MGEFEVNKISKPWHKRWQVWVVVFIALLVLGTILPAATDNKNEEVVKYEPKIVVKAEKTQNKTETKKITRLTKDEVLENFEVEPTTEPYLDGSFTFVGDRTDTADYYSLADNEHFRNASVIFKDGQIVRVKLIPNDAKNVNKLFESFGIKDKPRKLNGTAGFYEVALIPKYWSQNIEKYPYELD